MAQRAKERFECTFRPSLNPVTQSMGQAAPLDELVNNRRGQRVRERAQAKARCGAGHDGYAPCVI